MDRRTRRSFLAACGLTAAGLAGCTGGPGGDGSGDPTTGDPTTTARDDTTHDTTTSPTTTSDDATAASSLATWSVSLDGGASLAPTLVDDTLYVGDEGGTLYALDPASGTERWTFEVAEGSVGGVRVMQSPVVRDGTVYVVGGSHSGAHGVGSRLYAVDGGEETWSVERDYPSFLSLLGVDADHAYVATSDDMVAASGETLVAVDRASGDESWTREVGDPYGGSAVGAGGVYTGTWGDLRGFAADGSPRFTRDVGNPVDVVYAHDTLYTARDDPGDSAGYALDPETGDARWTIDRFVNSLAVADRVYAGGERIAAFSPDGDRRWRTDWAGMVAHGPVEGTLYASVEGEVRALAADDGDELWAYPFEAEFGDVHAATPSVAVVQPGKRGAVDGVDPASGDRRWRAVPEGDGFARPTARAGLVYLADSSGRLHALPA